MENAYDRKERTIYVNNMHKDTTSEELYDVFMKAGPIEKVILKDSQGQGPPPHALIIFKCVESVLFSVTNLSGTHLHGQQISLRPLRESSHATVLQRKMTPGQNMRSSNAPYHKVFQYPQNFMAETNRAAADLQHRLQLQQKFDETGSTVGVDNNENRFGTRVGGLRNYGQPYDMLTQQLMSGVRPLKDVANTNAGRGAFAGGPPGNESHRQMHNQSGFYSNFGGGDQSGYFPHQGSGFFDQSGYQQGYGAGDQSGVYRQITGAGTQTVDHLALGAEAQQMQGLAQSQQGYTGMGGTPFQPRRSQRIAQQHNQKQQF